MMIAIVWGIAAAFLLLSLAAGWAAKRRIETVGDWPTAAGRIVDAGVEARGNGTYAPRVSYAYTVGGKGFASDRLRPGGTPFFYSQAKAWAAVGPFAPGGAVTVFHHPAKPGRAAIELKPLSHAVLLFRILALAMAGVAALVTFA